MSPIRNISSISSFFFFRAILRDQVFNRALFFFLILQVLVNFSEETENESDGPMYAQSGSNNVSNVFSSMDTIHMDTFWSISLIRSNLLYTRTNTD